jgi:uncharacterized membrane protein
MMGQTHRLNRDQDGMVGKVAIVWLLLLAVLAIAAVDAASIALTKFKLSDTAVEAASDAAVEFRRNRDVTEACQVAKITVEELQPELKPGKNFCVADPETGRVTVTLRTTAGTVLAGRLDFTKKYVVVSQSETNGPSGV